MSAYRIFLAHPYDFDDAAIEKFKLDVYQTALGAAPEHTFVITSGRDSHRTTFARLRSQSAWVEHVAKGVCWPEPRRIQEPTFHFVILPAWQCKSVTAQIVSAALGHGRAVRVLDGGKFNAVTRIAKTAEREWTVA